MKRLTFTALVGISAVFSGACSDTDPAPAPQSTWSSEQVPEAGLRLEVIAGLDRADVRVLAAGSAEVFGVSYRLRFDESRLAVTDLQQSPFLGGEADTTMVAVPREGEIVLGGTRNGPDLGDTVIDDGAELAALTLLGTGNGDASIAVDNLVARRSDGSYVALEAERGTLTLAQVAP